MESNGTVVFLTPKKELELVRIPLGLKDQHGNPVRAVSYYFTTKKYGAAYETSNPDEIAWLRRHEYYLSQRITEAKPEDLEVVKPGAPVVVGGVTSTHKDSEPEAEKPPEALEHRGPGRPRRK